MVVSLICSTVMVLACQLSAVRLGACISSASAVFSAFGARLPVLPAAHVAKVAKLALSGLKQGNFFTLPSPGKTTAVHDVAPKNSPGCRL
ncbi:MAG: hypothetical protein JRJ56_00645 [Deltaproteobacteria bacterium]|nr:hypothetical protein [Deltaproteobacteria bacterium]